MSNAVREEIERFMAGLRKRNAGEPEFHQAVEEFVESVMPFYLANSRYAEASILERMTEPDRIITFRVTWMDDAGNIRVNRAWRVQFNNSIGPYKGGLRFHPSVTQGVLKFLGFEQVFKNALTTLPMGGGKGGSNFNPKGKSDNEIMRFCQSLMIELHHHIGERTDVPAGDIGVGSREISYLFGQYKRLCNRFVGALTGKGVSYGGSLLRTEATGYGAVYFTENMLNHRSDSVKGKVCTVSGSGNVATYAVEKINHLGGKAVSLSDSGGTIYDPDGIDPDKLEYVKDLKNVRRGRISEYADKFGVQYFEGKRPWDIDCDLAFPCATQNELDLDDAKALLSNKCLLVAEGANMPTTLEAARLFAKEDILFAPGKAANAGGVAVSGLEQSQNTQRMHWSAEEVDKKLQGIMHSVHAQCVEYGGTGENGHISYVNGANIGGFVKVADAMLVYGVV